MIDPRFRWFVPPLVAFGILGLFAGLVEIALGSYLRGLSTLLTSSLCLYGAHYLRTRTKEGDERGRNI